MANQREIIPLIGTLAVQHFQLENGLQIALVEDSSTPIFTYQTWFRVGSADEVPGKQGLAHLFEHMMFRKTKKREMGEWERQVNLHGGTSINAYTSRDQTVYFFTFPNDKLSLAADLESDRMQNLLIEKEMFETEKGAVLTERNRGLDSPGRYLWEELYKLAYQQHPYQYTIIGEEETIKNFTVEEAVKFYETFYSPNNALIIVAGDVKAEIVVREIEKWYGNIGRQNIRPSIRRKETVQTENRLRSLSHKRAQQKMLAASWHVPGFEHDDYIPLSLLSRILSAGKSSLLQERLVNKAKASSLYVDVFGGKECGTFEFFAQLTQESSFEEIQNIARAEFLRCAEAQVTEEQLTVAKNGLLKDYYQSVASPASLARILGDSFIFTDDLGFTLRQLPKFEKISVKDIAAAAQKYLIDSFSTTILLSPGQ